jgi:lipopolysaccharide export system permease protein
VRLVDRYILREFGAFFVIALGVTSFILLLDQLMKLGTFVLTNHLGLLTCLRLFGYTLATVSGLVVPMAFLIAATLTWNRFSTDSEYVVLQAAGLSLYRLLVPLFMVAILAYGASSFGLMYGAPWGFQGTRRLVFEVARRQAYQHLRPREFYDVFQGLALYVERIQPELGQLEGVFIADTRTAAPQVITAQTAELVTRTDVLQVILRLHNGTIHRYIPDDERYYLLRFGQYDVRLELAAHLAQQGQGAMSPHELFPPQLRAEIIRRQAAGKPPGRLSLLWHKLFAMPFACIIFAALGPVLGIVQTRSGRAGGYVLGLVAILIYNLLINASNTLGEETSFSPLIAAWLPNLAMGCLTVLLLRRTASGARQCSRPALWSWGLRPWHRWRSRSATQTGAAR